MRKIGLLLSAMAIMAIAGCSTVTSTVRLGAPSTNEASDKIIKELEGMWLANDEVIYIKPLKEGELRIAGVEWEGDHFKLQEMTAFLTMDQDVIYINWLNPESPKDQKVFLFGRIALIDGGTRGVSAQC